MKEKNIHVIERHIEKVILGVSCLFLLVVVWLYVLGQPYTVKVGSEQGVSPGLVNDRVVKAAADLEVMIGEHSVSPLDEIPVPAYTQLFRARIALAPTSVDELDPLGNPGLAEVGQIEFADPQPLDLVLPAPPAPVGVRAVQGFGVLPERDRLIAALAPGSAAGDGGGGDAVAVRLADAFAGLVPERAPRDFRYVSVAGSYDMGAWRAALAEPVDGEMIPEAWWRGALLLTGVTLERQARDPATGQWGEVRVVQGLPGALRVQQERESWVSNEAQQVTQTIREKQTEIVRPGFVPMDGVVPWITPVQMDGVVRPGATPGGASRSTGRALSTEVGGVVPIWAHDLTVRPGGEYRYRLRVWVYNPLFQQERVAEQKRQLYYNVLGIESESSVWSEPVTIEPGLRFFIVSGSRKHQTAKVQVWRVFNGLPRLKEFSVSPGDPIGGQTSLVVNGESYDVPMHTGMVMVDLVDPISGLSVEGEVTAALYLDVETGELIWRDIQGDVASPTRQGLREAAEMSMGAAEGADRARGR